MAVFEHPFFDVTGKDGTFELAGMPDGSYTIQAWHESFGTVTTEAEISGNTVVTKDITFEP